MLKFFNTSAGKWLVIALVVLVVLYFLFSKFGKYLDDFLGGDTDTAKNSVNASGQKVTAYQGAGTLGSLGAEFNRASGGVLASAGEWIGQHLPVSMGKW